MTNEERQSDRLRRRERLRNGTVVVTEYDELGRLLRETHYTADRAWVTKIVEPGPDERRPPRPR